MNRLLVIGGASSDVLHLEDRSAASAGGAGMYTAMAAVRAGAQASMFTIRPEPCPEQLLPVAELLDEWIGPPASPEDLPAFEISYRGGDTKYLKLFFGAEADLRPDHLPADVGKYDLVHIIPVGGVINQFAFVERCRELGANRISAGTFPGAATEQPEVVRAIMDMVDIFFMNDVEAEGVFGSVEAAVTKPGKLLFITRGAEGATVIAGHDATPIPAVRSHVLDPTGAGDTFCGATLAYLLQGLHPIMAARHAAALSAEMIQFVGPAALLSRDPAPRAAGESRVRISDRQVRRIAEKMATLSEVVPFPFVSPQLPPTGHPLTVDYFFAATLQQFGFWSSEGNRYHRPLIADIGGVRLKGSDYLWESYRRWMEHDPDCFSPQRQAHLSRDEMLEVFRADDGSDPMPAVALHLEYAQRYGRDMLALQLTPQTVLQKALVSDRPLRAFLDILDHVGGYKEDPLRKKSNLLAMILNQRPEVYLPFGERELLDAVIDYHNLRACLRTGLVEVVDRDLLHRLRNREVLTESEEWAVRRPTYRAVDRVSRHSGRSNGAVDFFIFSNSRRHCLEMVEPTCHLCPLDPVCAHRKELFQPVLRTTFY